LLRLALFVYYEPAVYPDTSTYFAAAEDLINGDLTKSEGRRTPGYPLVIALGQGSHDAIFAIQLLEGLICSALLFLITLRLTSRAGLAFTVGMLYNVNLQQLFLEGALLSETTATLALLGVIAALIAAYRRAPDAPPGLRLAAVGMLAGWAVLVRPQFIFLLILCPVLAALAWRRAASPSAWAWRAAVPPAIVGFGIVLAWCSFVFANTGRFTLTTQSGFSLVNHSVGFVELAPDRFATIRNILLKDRAITLAEKGHYGSTGWFALPEIRQATGMSLPEVSAEFQRMSIGLFVAHPLLYARSVARSWLDFWAVPIIWERQNLSPPGLWSPLEATWRMEQSVLRIANLALVLLCGILVMSGRVGTVLRWDVSLTTIVSIILGSSIVQALAEYGASARYATTIESLVLLVLAVAITRVQNRPVMPALRRLAMPASGQPRRKQSITVK
jgi:hypothetical protein